MKKILKNKKWYSIIVVIIIIWFLTVLTTWVLKLILWDLKDNRTIWSYFKAYAWAESAKELALLEIKEKWYESDKEIKDLKISDLKTATKNNKDVFISYKKDLKIKELKDFNLEKWKSLLIPLFYLDSSTSYKIKWITNFSISLNNPNISWNVISWGKWISWDGSDFTKWPVKTLNNYEFNLVEEITVSNFLADNELEKNYLLLLNWWTNDYKFTMSIPTSSIIREFSNPKVKIISSWEAGDYKTNIETTYDFTNKNESSSYSIYAP